MRWATGSFRDEGRGDGEGVSTGMWRRLRQRKGQSIVEYLVIVTIIIGAILLVRGVVTGNMNALFNGAAAQTATAGASLGTVTPE